MKKLFGISGKISSGKDLTYEIINYLNSYLSSKYSFEYTKTYGLSYNVKYSNKKFADMIKDIVCMLIGCKRSDLENREFKNKPLGKEWISYLEHHDQGCYILSSEEPKNFTEGYHEKRVMTPRLLMQLLGTEAGRNILHPNIWVNALFSNYNADSNWIITDVRFKNEADEIKRRGGILIRINRLSDSKPENEHASETGLDNYDRFDHIIDNNGTIEELVTKLKNIW